MQANDENMVSSSLDADNPPALTAELKAKIEALRAMPDEAIDHSDAPPIGDTFRLAANRPAGGKKQVTLRIDEDVLQYFRETGSRYQSRINSVLRAYVDAHVRHGAK
ncbi:MAG: BrnA antitoxin family protein [Azoarcus sp.]|jgi:uncharacterized protein (DUF4415 family)|nr:BrnA antitoxin family protein [Azoarcus sp.]